MHDETSAVKRELDGHHYPRAIHPMKTRRKRHIKVALPAEWVASVVDWRSKQGISQGELGRLAAEAVGAGEPFSHPTISRLERGHGSPEVVEAVAKLCGLSPPTIARLPAVEPRYELWLELGRRLERADARLFQEELADLSELVHLVERRAARRRDAD